LAFDRRLDCCGRTICASCQVKNPRFQNYCPFCQISSEPSALGKNGLRLPPSYSTSANNATTHSHDDPPPPYDSAPAPSHDFLRHTASAESPAQPPANTPDTVHHLSSNDTLASISVAYGVSASILKAHNNLYADHLLTARKFLLIPADLYRGPPLSAKPDPVEEQRKINVRRWMVRTKCVDYRVAELYLRAAIGVVDAVGMGSARGSDGDGGAYQERIVEEAVRAFRDDEDWERRNPLKGKGKGTARDSRRAARSGSLSAQLS
jgi:LysM repeat protein